MDKTVDVCGELELFGNSVDVIDNVLEVSSSPMPGSDSVKDSSDVAGEAGLVSCVVLLIKDDDIERFESSLNSNKYWFVK